MRELIEKLESVQHRRLITLEVETESSRELVIDSFTGREAISEPFSFELALLCEDQLLELKTLIGQPALLAIQRDDDEPRHIHGYISRFSYEKSDGGLGFYTATLSPWLWQLGLRSDSRIFQEVTALDVLKRVFAPYGSFAKYRFVITESFHFVPQGCITQFNETDEQFVRRLMEEEGLVFYFEHGAEGHTMIIADRSNSGAPELAQQPDISFLDQSIAANEDTISQWSDTRYQSSNAVYVAGFNYKHADASRSWGASWYSLSGVNSQKRYEHYQFHGQYRVPTNLEPRTKARLVLDALHAQSKIFRGESNCRAMLPGYFFTFADHLRHDGFRPSLRQYDPGFSRPQRSYELEFLLLSVEHNGRNNFLSGEGKAVYRNTFSCIRKSVLYRPPCKTPRPAMPGPLTAIVVGSQERDEVMTDHYARVKVCFHWQRLPPRDDSHQYDRAEYGAADTAWLRIAMPSAGEGFGHQFLPRVGQEVVVSFIAGDINQPLITGAVYNGDQVTPRFSTEYPSPESGHPLPANRALSGIKTREHRGTGYNELLFDDTLEQLRCRLASSYRNTALNLGRLSTRRTDGTTEPLGNGAELRSNAAIALRAAQGLLLSTYAGHQVGDHQLGREALLKLFDQLAELSNSLGQTALGQGAQAFDQVGMDALRHALSQWPAPDSQASGAALIALTGEAGIVSATPASQAHYAGANHDTVAHEHLQLTAGASMRLHAAKGISAFAQEDGIRAIANRGKVQVMAQDDDIALYAQHNINVAAAEGEVVLSAKTIRLVAEDGSYIKLGGGIEIGTASSYIVHAAEHDWVGPKTASEAITFLPSTEPICLECLKRAALTGAGKVRL